MTFSDLGLSPGLAATVAGLGYEAPSPIQAALVPVLLTGVDAVGQARTGTGKTAAFALPTIERLAASDTRGVVRALVLVPTRELAVQVASAMHGYAAGTGLRMLPVTGGAAYHSQTSRLRAGVDVVVATPGRLVDLLSQGAADLSAVETVVLDEADEMFSMGFADDLAAILDAVPDERQTVLLSATMPPGIRRLADAHLRNPETVAVTTGERTGTDIEQRAYLVHGRDKLAALVRLLETEDVASALVFVRTRAATAALAADLSRAGWPAEALSGELSQAARTDVLARFRRGDVRLLVATDVAARGLDIDHVSHVLNVDLPVEAEAYVHRVGRTGRAGRSGVALSLVAPGERNLLRRAEDAARREIPLAPLPTVEAVEAVRAARLRAAVEEAAPSDADRGLVAALVAEGLDPMDVAVRALALARAARGEAELAPIAEVKERAPRPQRAPFGAPPHGAGRPPAHAPHGGGAFRGPVGRSHEAGMVRVVLDAGRTSGVRPNVVVGALASSADVPGRALGKIVVQERRTFVDVPEALVDRVLAQSGAVRFGPRAVRIERA